MSDSSRSSVRSLLRRCWPLAAAVPLGALCGGAYALVAPVQYQANAYVMVVPEATSDGGSAINFAQAYGRVIAQPEILLGAAQATGVPLATLTPLVQAVTSPDAPMVQITGTAGTAAGSAQEANAVARSLVAFGNAASRQTRVTLITFASAAEPPTASSPSRSLDLAVGAAAGLLVGGLGMMAAQARSADGSGAPVPAPRIEEPQTPPTAQAQQTVTAEPARQSAQARQPEKAQQSEKNPRNGKHAGARTGEAVAAKQPDAVEAQG
ncbi:Wzz/FepE/Etk N-terminal domain-containing protein [Streptacidiphilus sp. EB129]|uniref:Wzz/FepE/Etk N-terminal domain-containing protein n=1 Tax=Streptacidiphilus sp. EB129 TaxID=3156262 RepID=UPI00351465A4